MLGLRERNISHAIENAEEAPEAVWSRDFWE